MTTMVIGVACQTCLVECQVVFSCLNMVVIHHWGRGIHHHHLIMVRNQHGHRLIVYHQTDRWMHAKYRVMIHCPEHCHLIVVHPHREHCHHKELFLHKDLRSRRTFLREGQPLLSDLVYLGCQEQVYLAQAQ